MVIVSKAMNRLMAIVAPPDLFSSEIRALTFLNMNHTY